MNRRRLSRSAALGLALAALAAPAAGAQQDLRSPDTRDAAEGYTPPPPSSIATPPGSPYQDLRSPDARDAADRRGSFNSPEVTVVKITQPSPATSSGGGLDWGDAGIGAAGLLGLILIGLGGTLAVLHRRQRQTGQPATTG
jgi:hypothetical protein